MATQQPPDIIGLLEKEGMETANARRLQKLADIVVTAGDSIVMPFFEQIPEATRDELNTPKWIKSNYERSE